MKGGSAANNKIISGDGEAPSPSTSIPAAARKIVQSLREIVSSPDQEIYAMLKECNMDPNETINRLLSQDTFHEVKRKREKKKESKEMTESRARGIGSNSSRGRGSADRNTVRNSSNYMNSADNSMYPKVAYKKDNEYDAYSSSASMVPIMTGNIPNRKNLSSNAYVDEHPSSFTASVLQPSWTTPSGQVSMADIVKSGRSHGRTPSISNPSIQHTLSPPSTALHSDAVPMPYLSPKESEQSEWPSEPAMFSNFSLKDESEKNHNLNYDTSSYTGIQMEHDNSVCPDSHDYDRASSCQPQQIYYDHKDGPLSVTPVAENLNRLNVPEDRATESDEDSCTVRIPDHLQVQCEQFSHLSFGSFGAGSQPLKEIEEALSPDDARSGEYYVDVHGKDVGGRESEALKEENADTAQGGNYPTYSFENPHLEQLGAFPHPQTSSQVLNHMNTLLPQSGREPDLAYLPFSTTQLPTRYGDSFSSTSASTISLSEVLRGGNLGPPVPQPLGLPHLPQQSLPLGHFTNMIGYPLLPQSYTYLPSAFQQAFGGGSSYHQSLPGVLPQYRNNISANQSAAIASGYGGFGSSAVHGGFPLNPPTAPTVSSTVGYEELLRSQYKDANPLLSLIQNDNPAMWVHGHATRAMPAIPTSSAYYGFQGLNPQGRQDLGNPGYPNLYQPHSGGSMELQQQNVRDLSVGGPQSQQQSKQTPQQQIWQNGY